jgi:DNA-binding transcriptional ArsR family regulator
MSGKSKSNSTAKRRLAEYESVFSALDHAARRQILLILHFHGDRMTSGEIAGRFSCAWPTTTRHLKKLEESGLVEVERSGREAIYTLNRKRMAVVEEWLSWFGSSKPSDIR